MLVIDDIDDPRILLRPIPINVIPAAIGCPTLFSSRRQTGKHFTELALKSLDEDSAVHLLTRNWRGEEAPQRHDGQYTLALAVCRTLGMLPLALEVASSQVGSIDETNLTRYLVRLEKHGALPVLDSAPQRLSEYDLATRHPTAILATLSTQWELITNLDSRELILTIALFAEGLTISEHLLVVLAPDSLQSDIHYDTFTYSLEDLAGEQLVERLAGSAIRASPARQ